MDDKTSFKRDLLVVGDRVFIKPLEGHDKTSSGLYLPQGIQEKEKVQCGTIVKVGPGYPIPDLGAVEAEPWQVHKFENKYFPLQAKEGDDCIFLRNSAIEVEFENEKYVIVPHSAILVILRNRT